MSNPPDRAPRVDRQMVEYLRSKFGTQRDMPLSTATDVHELNARIGENRVIRDLEELLHEQTKGR